MDNKSQIKRLRAIYNIIKDDLNERLKRLWAAAEAQQIGWGGISIVAIATKLDEKTIRAGIKDLSKPGRKPKVKRIRKAGGGRKSLESAQPGIMEALLLLIDPNTRGDPEGPLKWTSKSTRKLANELQNQGFKISSQTVRTMLRAQGYSLQANKKTLEGASDPHRDDQFNYISDQVKSAIDNNQPVISVDTKKKRS